MGKVIQKTTDFVFSSGWLSAFKARGGIRRQKLHGDTNSQVNTLVKEFLDYNEDEANLNISPEVVDIEEIIDYLKSVDNEEDRCIFTTSYTFNHNCTSMCTSMCTPYRASSVSRSSIDFLVEQSLI